MPETDPTDAAAVARAIAERFVHVVGHSADDERARGYEMDRLVRMIVERFQPILSQRDAAVREVAFLRAAVGECKCLICGAPATTVMHYPYGCFCRNETVQARCAQHAEKEPGEPVTMAELIGIVNAARAEAYEECAKIADLRDASDVAHLIREGPRSAAGHECERDDANMMTKEEEAEFFRTEVFAECVASERIEAHVKALRAKIAAVRESRGERGGG